MESGVDRNEESPKPDSGDDYFDTIEANLGGRAEERSTLLNDRARADERMRQLLEERARLRLLLDVSGRINSVLSTRDVLERVMDAVIQVAGAQRGFLVLLDSQREPHLEISRNLDGTDHEADETYQISRTILNRAIQSGRTVFENDAMNNPAFTSYKSVRDLSLRTVICLPLRIDQRDLGAIYLDSRSVSDIMTAEGQELLEAFASQAAVAIANALAHDSLKTFHSRLEVENRSLKRALRTEFSFDSILGQSAAIRRIFEVLGKVADTTVTVLIQGETGTGKEMVARAIHNASPRREAPFMPINCAAIPDALLEGELFGYRRGAFTGASEDKVGLIETAHGGTVLLDEIGDMPLTLQTKILRVVQDKELQRLGESSPRKVDVRWLAATNRNLEVDVQGGRFRQDLYYRLNVVSMVMPPLRDRPEDILLLADHFLRQSSARMKRKNVYLTAEGRSCLLAHSWPGNVRELENALERACALTTEGAISNELLVPAAASAMVHESEGGTLKDRLLRAERVAIDAALRRSQGNISRAAQALSVSRQHLHNRIRKLEMGTPGRS